MKQKVNFLKNRNGMFLNLAGKGSPLTTLEYRAINQSNIYRICPRALKEVKRTEHSNYILKTATMARNCNCHNMATTKKFDTY
jgi:hypothetical protein